MLASALIVVAAVLIAGAVYVARRRNRIDPSDENDGVW